MAYNNQMQYSDSFVAEAQLSWQQQTTLIYLGEAHLPQQQVTYSAPGMNERKSNSTYHVWLPIICMDTFVDAPPEVIFSFTFPGIH